MSISEQDRKTISDIIEGAVKSGVTVGVLKGFAKQHEKFCGPRGERIQAIEGDVRRVQEDIACVKRRHGRVDKANGRSPDQESLLRDPIFLKTVARYAIAFLFVLVLLVNAWRGNGTAKAMKESTEQVLEQYKNMSVFVDAILGVDDGPQNRSIEYTTGTQ